MPFDVPIIRLILSSLSIHVVFVCLSSRMIDSTTPVVLLRRMREDFLRNYEVGGLVGG